MSGLIRSFRGGARRLNGERRTHAAFALSLAILFAGAARASGQAKVLPGAAPGAPAVTAAAGTPARVPAAALIAQAKAYDSKVVLIEGELIGDVMKRGSHVWLSVLDDGTAIGVWADSRLAGAIGSVGGYNRTGDRVRIVGVLNRACPEHGGDLDIHASSAEIVGRGQAVAHPVSAAKAVAAAVLAAAGILFASIWRRREKA